MAFGIPDERAWGVDVSSVQGAIDYPRLAASGCSWVTAKATEGTSSIDSRWYANAKGIRAAGMLVAAYHVFSPSKPIEEQVAHFTNVAIGLVDLPPTIDFELPRPELWIPPITAGYLLRRFLLMGRLVCAAFGRRSGYTYPYFGNSIIKGVTGADGLILPDYADDVRELADTPLWIASYHDEKHAPKITDRPTIPLPWTDWQFWQWSGDKGLSAPGIPTVVDHDIFNGSTFELARLVLPAIERCATDPNLLIPPGQGET